jgi:hypothetical protein
MNADCYEDRGATFGARKIFIENNLSEWRSLMMMMMMIIIIAYLLIYGAEPFLVLRSL